MKDGVVYDTDTARVLHDPNSSLAQFLAVTPEGHYFVAVLGGLFLGWVIFPRSHRRTVEFAIKYKAHDNVLKRLGVTIQSPRESEDPYEQQTARFIWMKERLLGRDWLLQNHDGRYFLLKNRRLFRWRWQRTRPMDQRQALWWALRDYADDESLEMLGLSLSE